MRCEEFLTVVARRRLCDGDAPLAAGAAEHLAGCARCQREAAFEAELEATLRRALERQAVGARPRPAAVGAAVAAALGALESETAPARPKKQAAVLHFVPPMAGSVARWAVAAAIILGVGLLSGNQPFSPPPTWADATATVAAAMPSATPAPTGTVTARSIHPAALSLLMASATPGRP